MSFFEGGESTEDAGECKPPAEHGFAPSARPYDHAVRLLPRLSALYLICCPPTQTDAMFGRVAV